MSAMASGTAESGRHAFISYYPPNRLYGLCWSTKPNDFRLAVSTFITGEYVNKIQILQPSVDRTKLVCAFEIDHPYPPTKIMWSPHIAGNTTEYIATTADYLRLWAVSDTSLRRHATISNKRNHETCAPLTSFDWNEAATNIIGTSSIDTTCTIWDLNDISEPKHQIIAHDDEVYDMAFSDDANTFASVGGDSSLRVFDLRDLESSIIAYESPDHKPMVRIAWNKRDTNYIACLVSGTPKVVILDQRNVTRPVFEISQHTANVNSISWAPYSRHHICSASEDRSAIVYDISTCANSDSSVCNPPSAVNSSLFFRSTTAINQISWSPTQQNCISLCDEDAVHVVQV